MHHEPLLNWMVLNKAIFKVSVATVHKLALNSGIRIYRHCMPNLTCTAITDKQVTSKAQHVRGRRRRGRSGGEAFSLCKHRLNRATESQRHKDKDKVGSRFFFIWGGNSPSCSMIWPGEYDPLSELILASSRHTTSLPPSHPPLALSPPFLSPFFSYPRSPSFSPSLYTSLLHHSSLPATLAVSTTVCWLLLLSCLLHALARIKSIKS